MTRRYTSNIKLKFKIEFIYLFIYLFKYSLQTQQVYLHVKERKIITKYTKIIQETNNNLKY